MGCRSRLPRGVGAATQPRNEQRRPPQAQGDGRAGHQAEEGPVASEHVLRGGTSDGTPVPVTVTIEVTFTLED